MSKNKTYLRRRPDYRFSVEWDRGDMFLVFADKRIPIEESDGQYWFSDSPMLGPAATLPDLYDKVAMEPVTSTGSSPFRIRKNFLDLTEFERVRFSEALNYAYESGFIKKAAKGHNKHRERIHRVPQFLPWHRLFLIKLERKMQQFDPDVTLPYWDSSREDAQSFDTEMLGTFFGGRANNSGPFQHWKFERRASDPDEDEFVEPSFGHILYLLYAPTFRVMREFENIPLHSWAHDWVGGNMADATSPRDPLFWLHHSNVDRLWAMWQRNNPMATQYDTFRINGDISSRTADGLHSFMEPAGLGITFAPQSLLDHRNWGYAYAADLQLEKRFQDDYSRTILSGDKPEFTVSPRTWEFGSVEVGDSLNRNIRLENALNVSAKIKIDSSSAQGGSQSGFFWDEMIRTFSPGEVKTLPVMFVPSSTGYRTTELQVVIDTSGTAAVGPRVKLLGSGK